MLLPQFTLHFLQQLERNFFIATSSTSKNKSNNYAYVPRFSVTAHLTGVATWSGIYSGIANFSGMWGE
jgi:hypothetical protein